MKRYFILSLLLALNIAAFAQRKMIIHLSDGTTIEKEVWEVDRITFGETDPVTVTQPDDNTAVDLGLSVKWANMNLGATNPKDKGLLVGWADPTGTIKSTEFRYYPSEYPEEDIIGTKLDIATSLWRAGWRLPSDEEFQELISQCEWTAVKDNGVLTGFNVSRNGNTIFLPATGYRNGKADAGKTDKGYYWTGILDTYQKYGKSVYLAADDTVKADSAYRYLGLAVRPVFGPYYHVKFISLTPSKVSTNSADITAKLSGTLSEYNSYTLYWTTDQKWGEGNIDSLSVTPGDLADGSYTYHLEGLQYNTPYFYKIAVKREGYVKTSDVQQFQTAYTHINFVVTAANNIRNNSCFISVKYTGTLEKYKEIGLVYSTSEDFAKCDTLKTSEESLDEDSYARFSLSNLSYITKYYYKAYAKGGSDDAKDEESDVKSFTTAAKYASEAVDLGLPSGLKWSKYNLGAEYENEIGGYFCWADPNEVGKDQNTYPRLVEHSPKNIGGTEYDVATKTLGGQWHIPDSADFVELQKYCKWTFEGNILGTDGKTYTGYKVSNPNDDSKYILLVKAGNRQGDGSYYHTTTEAYFWTSNNYDGLRAQYFTFASSAQSGGHVSNTNKYIGMNIRPVYGEVTSEKPVVVDSTQISKYDGNAVDLGLSVAWSSCELGATSDNATGYMYAWGELEHDKGSYTSDNYKYKSTDASTNYYVNIGNNISGNSSYDPATKEWGGNWRMPTETEFRELADACTWTWDASNSQFIITSTINGNKLYWKVSDSKDYWLGNLYTRSGDDMSIASAYYFTVKPGSKPVYSTYYYRYIGKYIRPVKDPYDANKNKK